MSLLAMMVRKRGNVAFICMFVVFFIFFFHLALPKEESPEQLITTRRDKYPLVWNHIHKAAGPGGAWYIPDDWLPTTIKPENITHAAQLAAAAANDKQRYLSHSSIPRIVHQAWKSTDIDQFPAPALPAVESWLEYAVAPDTNMAYFIWDDQGIIDLIAEAEPDLLFQFEALPKMVEKADIFRIVVCNSVGGVYGDIDTTPLRPPTEWVQAEDILPWSDPATDIKFATEKTTNPVKLILGIEADTDEHSDQYWRMGYTYSVQLTQWALAGTADHPILNSFLVNFRSAMDQALLSTTHSINGTTVSQDAALRKLDPLELTGPAAITVAANDYLAKEAGLRWQALSGIEDGGHSKLVLDTLILPITGFSPGRGKYGNMGSKPFSDPDARLRHDAQGSWKKFDLMVELGKTCRTLLGGCRDWSKVPG